MRAGTLLLLAAERPEDHFEGAELERIAGEFREHIRALIPTVRARACVLPQTFADRTAALACIDEAQGHLHMGDGDSDAVRGAVAARLARSVKSLCWHYDRMAPR
ncbi:DUF6415 family natural product biosynthesis protein [Streptomyces sp. NPDC001220]